jgi:hypothetical protein
MRYSVIFIVDFTGSRHGAEMVDTVGEDAW